MGTLSNIVKVDIESYLRMFHTDILFNERDFQMHLATYLKEVGTYDDVDLEYFVPTSLLDGYKDLWDTELRVESLYVKVMSFVQ